MNVLAVKELVKLCRNMKNLKVMHHVHVQGNVPIIDMYIVVAVPKQDSMSPARANAGTATNLLDIYVISHNQLVGTTHSYSCLKPFKQESVRSSYTNHLQTTLCSTVA